MKKRIGVFGGTFNPPHMGHITSAKAFLDQMLLDELIVIPAFVPPHKERDLTVSPEQRLRMCNIAFSKLPRTTVSDLEIKRGGKSYTYMTLEDLTSNDIELFFLCGTDMILTMDTWRLPERIFELATVCYVRRENDPETAEKIKKKCDHYVKEYGATIFEIFTDVINVSSTQIREDLNKDMMFISDELSEYIKEAGLYK